MSCCVPTDIWREKAYSALAASELKEAEVIQMIHLYIESLERPPAQKRVLLEDFLAEPDSNLRKWLEQSSSDLGKQSIPHHYKPLVAEIKDNYLNSNN